MKDGRAREEWKDSELTARIQRGETEYLDLLIERHYDGIFRFCLCKTGNREAAYDCAQETFLHLLRYLEAYTEQKKFKAWLYRIASNVCMDYFRKEARAPAGEEALETLWKEDAGFEQIEHRELVGTALNQLSENQRETIVLYFFHGFKLREIAEITDAKMSTVKSRFRQGMEKLKAYMEKTRALAHEQGFVQTAFGRRLWLPDIASSKAPVRAAAERAAINAPMQGTAADLIKKAMIAVQAWIEENHLKTLLVLQVHDELVLEVPHEELEMVKEALPKLMQNVAQLAVPLIAEVGSGDSWESAH